MSEGIHTIVVDSSGARGSLINRGGDADHVIIDLGDGDRRRVPRTSLRPQPDLTIRVEGQLTDYEAVPVHPMHLLMKDADVPISVPPIIGASAVQEIPLDEPPVEALPVVETIEEESAVIPVIEEQVHVDTKRVDTGGVRVHKTVHETEHLVQTPSVVEEVDVERVPIGRVVSEAPPVRTEGNTTVISVVEEILVVEKRLLLKEEVRITKTRRTVPNEGRVTLRHEQVEVERLSAADPETPV